MLHIKRSLKLGSRYRRRRFLKGFYRVCAWRPVWSCDPDAANKFPRKLHIKFSFEWLSDFGEDV